MTGGTANTMVASRAGILPGPNSMTKGIRYTKIGIVCMMSSTGRMMRSIRSERDIRMPIGMPATTASKVAVSIRAMVFILGSHRPKKPIRKVMSPRPRAIHLLRVAARPNPTIARITTYHGSHRRKSSIARSKWTIGRKISSSVWLQCSTIQLKESSMAMRTGRMFNSSGNCCAISLAASPRLPVATPAIARKGRRTGGEGRRTSHPARRIVKRRPEYDPITNGGEPAKDARHPIGEFRRD